MDRPDEGTMNAAQDMLMEGGYGHVWEYLAWLDSYPYPRSRTPLRNMARVEDRVFFRPPVEPGPRVAPFVRVVCEWARHRPDADRIEIDYSPMPMPAAVRVTILHRDRVSTRTFDPEMVVRFGRGTLDGRDLYAILDGDLFNLICPPIPPDSPPAGPPPRT